MKGQKETIGVKIPAEWKEEIKQVSEDLGISPSQWLLEAIGVALQRPGVGVIRSLPDRVAALESKLSRLAK